MLHGANPHAADFNSRPSARGDLYLYGHLWRKHVISIHAPPRGATNDACSPCVAFQFQFTPLREGRRSLPTQTECGGDFNSRPSARGDTSSCWAASAASVFQFTPLREGRLVSWLVYSATLYFNSRPSARGDRDRCRFQLHHQISIHAPPRGATHKGQQ